DRPQSPLGIRHSIVSIGRPAQRMRSNQNEAFESWISQPHFLSVLQPGRWCVRAHPRRTPRMRSAFLLEHLEGQTPAVPVLHHHREPKTEQPVHDVDILWTAHPYRPKSNIGDQLLNRG